MSQISHYNAFISYKHAPEDNRVADAVHKGLERFHIPGKLRKKTGIKKINRIFRDKAELPITMDLSDNISYALENSDYLIVLCSTNTKESAWVPREIEAFLENHTKRDVFTVLVNGEPHDVIPEILQYEERAVEAQDGSTQMVKVPIEPLSCDYRIPFRKAKKEELPRLAAGLIGCAYDEIMNRQRQYRIKRLTALFSIAFAIVLGFAGYMFYSRAQIHKNYQESLKNQSRYLANESESLLDKEQRITALQLALEALPKDSSDDRPVTAEAVKALTDATLAYEGNNGVNIHAAWIYEMPNRVNDFKLSSDGKMIALLDSGSVVGVWDTQTHERKMYFDNMDEKVMGIAFPDDASFVMWTKHDIYCYDSKSGEKRWESSFDKDTFDEDSDVMISDNSFYISTRELEYKEYDLSSGEKKSESTFAPETGIKTRIDELSVLECKISPNKKKIAFRALKGWNEYAYGVLDIASNNMMVSDVMPEMIKDIEWVDDDTFMIASTKVDNTASSSYGGMEIISTDNASIKCINASDITEKWHAVFTCNGVKLNSDFVSLGKDTVGYYSGNVFTLYNTATGEVKYSNNVNSSILDVSDRDGDGKPLYITEDGSYVLPALTVDKDAAQKTKYFTDELRQVTVNHGVYARKKDATEVIHYSAGVYDKEWTELKSNAFLSDSSKYTIIGSYDDRFYVQTHDAGTDLVKSFELVGDELKSEDVFEIADSINDKVSMTGGKIFYIKRNKELEPVLNVYDISTGDVSETVLKVPEDWDTVCAVGEGKTDGVTAVSYGNEIVLYDKKGEEKVRISCTGLTPYGMMFTGENLLVLYNDGNLYQYSAVNGDFVRKTDVLVHPNYVGSVSFDLDTGVGLLFIQMGKLAGVIDMESFAQTAHIDNCFGRLKSKDIFITLSKESDMAKVGYYKRYTVEELIVKAKDMLKNAELSEATKSRYGIR